MAGSWREVRSAIQCARTQKITSKETILARCDIRVLKDECARRRDIVAGR